MATKTKKAIKTDSTDELSPSSGELEPVPTNHAVITSGLDDVQLVARYVDVTGRANQLRPRVSVARRALSEARSAMEESEAFRRWQAAHDQVKALGTCRALDSEAHVLQLVAKERGLKLPRVS